MNLIELRRLPEERVAAVMGVPAVLAGLGAGLNSATYNNTRELREYFTEQKLVPLWRTVADELTYQLLPEFDLEPDSDDSDTDGDNNNNSGSSSSTTTTSNSNTMSSSDNNQGIPSPKFKIGDSCLLYTSPSPRDLSTSRMPSSA